MKLGEVGADFFTPPQMNAPASPELDQAMGYDIQPGDDAGAQFSKTLQSMLYRGSPEGRQLVSEIAKQKIANQLSLQLQQQQAALARINPEYQHFVSTGLGTVLAIDKFGNTATLGQENPTLVGMRQAELARTQAETGSYQAQAQRNQMLASPEYMNAELQDKKATAAYKNAQANALPEVQAARSAQAQALAQLRSMQTQKPGADELQLDKDISALQNRIAGVSTGSGFVIPLTDEQKAAANNLLTQKKQQLQQLQQQRQSRAMSGGLLSTPQTQQNALDPSGQLQLQSILGDDEE